jgi:hypothetical protein
MIKSFFSKLFGFGSNFSHLDRLVLGSIRRELDPSIGALWDRQVDAINKIQRLPGGVEVNFYRLKNGRPSFESEIAFPNRTLEILIATLNIRHPNISDQVHAKVWSVRGFLFSIEYAGAISYFLEASAMDPPVGLIVHCQLYADLAEKKDEQEE